MQCGARREILMQLLTREHKFTTPREDRWVELSSPVLDHDPERSEEEHVISDWSRSPSPVADVLVTETPASNVTAVEESWDAAQEMDAHAEEGEFARFLSQVKGKDLDDVRREIDDEIMTLNLQKKAAMRDSEDITQQMIAQIMVRSYASFLSFTATQMMLRLFKYPVHHGPHGGGSAVCRTCRARPRRRHHRG